MALLAVLAFSMNQDDKKVIDAAHEFLSDLFWRLDESSLVTSILYVDHVTFKKPQELENLMGKAGFIGSFVLFYKSKR